MSISSNPWQATADDKERIAAKIYDGAFSQPRNPRSRPYKEGVLAGIKAQMLLDAPKQPYRLGTPQADAWFSGLNEGRSLIS